MPPIALHQQVAALTPEAATEAYLRLLGAAERQDEVALKVREEAIYRLAKLYVTARHFDKVLGLLQTANPFFFVIPKVRANFDFFPHIHWLSKHFEI
jgi:hypothetical protein